MFNNVHASILTSPPPPNKTAWENKAKKIMLVQYAHVQRSHCDCPASQYGWRKLHLNLYTIVADCVHAIFFVYILLLLCFLTQKQMKQMEMQLMPRVSAVAVYSCIRSEKATVITMTQYVKFGIIEAKMKVYTTYLDKQEILYYYTVLLYQRKFRVHVVEILLPIQQYFYYTLVLRSVYFVQLQVPVYGAPFVPKLTILRFI